MTQRSLCQTEPESNGQSVSVSTTLELVTRAADRDTRCRIVGIAWMPTLNMLVERTPKRHSLCAAVATKGVMNREERR